MNRWRSTPHPALSPIEAERVLKAGSRNLGRRPRELAGGEAYHTVKGEKR